MMETMTALPPEGMSKEMVYAWKKLMEGPLGFDFSMWAEEHNAISMAPEEALGPLERTAALDASVMAWATLLKGDLRMMYTIANHFEDFREFYKANQVQLEVHLREAMKFFPSDFNYDGVEPF